ncbi:MIF-like protein mif-2 [Tachypleus tridentatus]|uniref:MIF-like protein mif-2 n=1 Tax=Tachypleus tridentatus TaxID=6853 RepID=UPI003FD09CA4
MSFGVFEDYLLNWNHMIRRTIVKGRENYSSVKLQNREEYIKMPLCRFETNISNVPKDFHILLSNLVADILGKPLEKVSVAVYPGLQMCRGGTDDPTCQLFIWSIGVFGVEQNPKYAGPLYELIKEKLGIPDDRIVVVFHDLKPHELVRPL